MDREYYVMQSEFYTDGEIGAPGFQAFSSLKGMAEEPEYVVFNGRIGALTEENSLRAEVGETVRLFVGNIGPNLISSFHVIGEIFDRVYREGQVNGPERNIQTTLIPAGSASIAEFGVQTLRKRQQLSARYLSPRTVSTPTRWIPWDWTPRYAEA